MSEGVAWASKGRLTLQAHPTERRVESPFCSECLERCSPGPAEQPVAFKFSALCRTEPFDALPTAACHRRFFKSLLAIQGLKLGPRHLDMCSLAVREFVSRDSICTFRKGILRRNAKLTEWTLPMNSNTTAGLDDRWLPGAMWDPRGNPARMVGPVMFVEHGFPVCCILCCGAKWAQRTNHSSLPTEVQASTSPIPDLAFGWRLGENRRFMQLGA